MKIILFISIAILISSCATMTPKECKKADWKKIGYKDGSQGEVGRLSKHTNACEKINITPDKAKYMSGYRRGERIYCTYDNGLKKGRSGGFNDGLTGASYRICKATGLRENFYRGYIDGYKSYEISQSIIARAAEEERKKEEKIKLRDAQFKNFPPFDPKKFNLKKFDFNILGPNSFPIKP